MTKKEFFHFIGEYVNLSPQQIEKDVRYMMNFKFDGDKVMFRAFKTWSGVVWYVSNKIWTQDLLKENINLSKATELYFKNGCGRIEGLNEYLLDEQLDFIDKGELQTFLESKNQPKTENAKIIFNNRRYN